MTRTAYRITGPRWTFAIIVVNGIVVDAAPISAKWIGQPARAAVAWWRSKGADGCQRLEVRWP